MHTIEYLRIRLFNKVLYTELVQNDNKLQDTFYIFWNSYDSLNYIGHSSILAGYARLCVVAGQPWSGGARTTSTSASP